MATGRAVFPRVGRGFRPPGFPITGSNRRGSGANFRPQSRTPKVAADLRTPAEMTPKQPPSQRSTGRPRYEQSSIAKGAYWAHQASSLAFELVFPALVGAGVDWYFGVAPWGIVVGGVVGFALLMTHLVQMAKKSAADLDRQYPKRGPDAGFDESESNTNDSGP